MAICLATLVFWQTDKVTARTMLSKYMHLWERDIYFFWWNRTMYWFLVPSIWVRNVAQVPFIIQRKFDSWESWICNFRKFLLESNLLLMWRPFMIVPLSEVGEKLDLNKWSFLHQGIILGLSLAKWVFDAAYSLDHFSLDLSFILQHLLFSIPPQFVSSWCGIYWPSVTEARAGNGNQFK